MMVSRVRLKMRLPDVFMNDAVDKTHTAHYADGSAMRW
jgi:hypothetical protein